MKNLDFDAYGVQEMNQQEMKKVDGGINWILFVAVALIGLAWGYIDGKK